MNSKEKYFIIIGIVIGIAGFAILIGFIGQGNVRHVQIFWQEKVEQTVVFEEIDGKIQLRGISGIAGDPNPTLITRAGFVYILTVVNNDDDFHRLYIDGLEVQTELLEPGQQDTITVYPEKEATYNYYDKTQFLKKLGQLQIVQVVPSDTFEGFLRDMI